jgi:bleomycin hydrolase
MSEDFRQHKVYELIQNAVTQVSADKLTARRRILAEADHSFSIHLDDWKVTSQEHSGRCWLFAGTNLLRVNAMKKMRLQQFEFSQNWLLFWDKLEKANFFIEAIIETADRALTDRTVWFLLQNPVSDGGQWNMFVNVVKKYGLVPKAAMPETESSSNTDVLNVLLAAKLRLGAKQVRDLYEDKGPWPAAAQKVKSELLNQIYRILCIHLGTPPQLFTWQWHEEKKRRAFHRDQDMLPLAFAKKYVSLPLDEYVSLVHDPRPTSPRGRTFTVQYLGNVWGGKPVVYLNVDIKLMKQIALRILKDKEPVWFGCDVCKMLDREAGLLDADLRDYEGLYNMSFALNKAERLQYGATCMTHAMLFTGVDILHGKPRRWRVENSWGEKAGKQGFFLMNDSWFEEHMFEIAVRKTYLPRPLQKALLQKPIVLPPWDPMGSLAR